jgi:uncharacterized protein (TIGR03083 family)
MWHPEPVDVPGYQAYDVAAHIRALRSEGELLAAAAERAGMGAAVPACAGWSVGDLLRHTSHVHRWAAGIVGQRITRPAAGPSEHEILRNGPGDDSVLGWFRDGHAALVATLEEASPDVKCWAFLSAPSPLAFWARRQAHETAMHRVDAEQAAGGAPRFEPAFAADGVDELIMGFLARNMRRGGWAGVGGSLAIRAEDGPGAQAGWLVGGGPGAGTVSRGTGPADCTVTGRASDLYLLVWNRAPADTVAVTGDPGVLAAFGREVTITW